MTRHRILCHAVAAALFAAVTLPASQGALAQELIIIKIEPIDEPTCMMQVERLRNELGMTPEYGVLKPRADEAAELCNKGEVALAEGKINEAYRELHGLKTKGG